MQVDPQVLQVISIIVAISSIVVAFIIGVRSIRNYAVSRKASVFISYQTQAYNKELMLNQMEIFNRWSFSNYEDFFQKYGPRTNPEAYAKFISVLGFYEGLARLLKKGIIDADLIPESVVIGIIMLREKIQPIRESFGQNIIRSQSDDLIDYLYNLVKSQQQLPE